MIKLFCDMGADLPKKIVEKYNINVLKMPITDGENEYILGETINKKELFENMAKGTKYSTSQVTFKDFYDNFKREIEEGNDVLYISISSGISGTYNTAIMAKNQIIEENPNSNIFIEDSKGASFGTGLMVVKVAELLKDGASIDEAVSAIKFFREHMKYIFSVDDLTYLHRGGRLNKTKFIIGSLLNICPILTIEKENGTLSMIDKVRGNKALNKKIQSMTSNDLEVMKKQTVFVLHGDCIEKANNLKNFLQTELNLENIDIMELDAVIGCHTGPNIIVVLYLDKTYGKYDNIKFN